MALIFQRHLTIDGSSLSAETGKAATSKIYEVLILNQLQFIAKTNTGFHVLHELHTSVRQVRIVPSPRIDVVKSDAGPTNWNNATYPCRPVRDGAGKRMKLSYPFGTGFGSDVIVRHNPWLLGTPELAAILVHELTHAAEEADGKLVCNPLGWSYDTQAEFDAILVQNIFNSEAKLPLVRDHETGMVLDKPLMVPKPAFIRLLQSFRARMPRLAQQLGDVDTAYNPLRKGSVGYVGVQGDIPGSSRFQ